MTIRSHISRVLQRVAKDIRALAERVGFLERNLSYLTLHISVSKSEPDVEGRYKRITYHRANGTLFKVSLLEVDPMLTESNGPYNKRVVSIYNKAGDTIIDSASYQLMFDAAGVIVSETLLS